MVSDLSTLFCPTFPALPLEKQKPRVFVVDDEASIRNGCIVTLRLDGWLAEGEASSQVALERLNRGTEHFDALVIDYAMPELDGLALAAALDPKRRPPILLASAHADGAVALSALRLGIWDFLAKPLVPEELRYRVRRLYTRVQDSAESSSPMARILQDCNRCAWEQALAQLNAWPEEGHTESSALIRGLVCQLMGDETGAVKAFQRARWWPAWHQQGVEIWTELAKRLSL